MKDLRRGNKNGSRIVKKIQEGTAEVEYFPSGGVLLLSGIIKYQLK